MAYNFINETGVIVAGTSAIKAEVEAEYLAVFGADLDYPRIEFGEPPPLRSLPVTGHVTPPLRFAERIAGETLATGVAAATDLQYKDTFIIEENTIDIALDRV